MRTPSSSLTLLIWGTCSNTSRVSRCAERVSSPLISIRTLRGSGFSSLRPESARGSRLLGKGPGHLMPTVVAEAVRCARAFSGAAATRVVGDVGRRT